MDGRDKTAPGTPPHTEPAVGGAPLTLEGLLIDLGVDPTPERIAALLTPAARLQLIAELAAGLPAPADGYAHEVGGAAFALLRWPLPGGGAVELRQPLTEAERARLAEYPPLEGRRCAPLREVRP